jgi:hypothetical protein
MIIRGVTLAALADPRLMSGHASGVSKMAKVQRRYAAFLGYLRWHSKLIEDTDGHRLSLQDCRIIA